MQEHNSALNITTDPWTSPNHKAYVAVTVHYQNLGVPISMLLDLVKVACLHSGFNLVKAFSNILEDFGISDKVSFFFIAREPLKLTRHGQILSITADNASNNDTMIESLGVLIDDFSGASNQTQCFLHILNLVVKSILKQFDLLKSKEKVKMDDNDGGDENDEIMYKAAEELLKLAGDVKMEGELMADDDEHDKMTEDELKELSANILPVRLLLTKVKITK